MLRDGLQVIVQYRDGQPPASSICRGFLGIHVLVPSYVVLIGTNPQPERTAQQIGAALCQRLGALAAATEVTGARMPCGGRSGPDPCCHAMDVASCRKLLLLVGDGSVPPWVGNMVTAPQTLVRWITQGAADQSWEILPILPEGSSPTSVLPPQLRGINVAFWRTNPAAEVLPGVFQRMGLAPEESRVFISYIRRETLGLADQLFDELV